MGTVVELDVASRLDVPVERILARVADAELELVIVIGYLKDGGEYFLSSIADGGDCVWLLERAKLKLLRLPDEEDG